MEVISKLYSSVSSTVSQLSAALPGNPLTREFDALQHIASAGPGLQWRIYKGVKKSTKQEASIFVFEKRFLERWTKADREIMLETLKRGVTQLTKLRHPQLLTLQHPLEESRDSLAFATEPVFASLANVLGDTENMPQPVPSHITDYKLYEVEIKYGLVQIAEGLSFLHSDVKLLHKNLCPESIVINRQGAWKIFGFDFCVLNQNGANPMPFYPFTEYCPAMHPLTQPNLDFLAPECVLSASHSPSSDLYSLGMIIYCLHSTGGNSLNNCQNNYNKSKKFATELKQLPLSKLNCINDGLKDYVKLMLNFTPELRPDPHQFIKIPYFEDVGVKTLNYLDSLFQWDNLQKSQFYKGLPQIISKLPHRVCIYRILPCLTKEFVNPQMVPFVLPNVLLIAENSTKEEFSKHILPSLKPVMTMQDPIQILLIFMQKMELLLKLTPAEEIKSDVLCMLYRALESDAQQIQELCLSVIPTFASLIDFPAMKNALLPRIKKLCISTNYLSVRVNCLLCLGKLLEHLDKWLVLDEVLPLLPKIPSREPAVLMGILGVYKLAMTHKKLGITKEVMATKILPFLMPLCIENGLTLNQFNSLISLVKEMVNLVENEHRTKLEQLNSIQNESKAFEANLSATVSPFVSNSNSAIQLDNSLSDLNLNNFDKEQINQTSTKSQESLNLMTNGSTGTSLSLQEKQRIAQQQESFQRLSQQKPILALQQKISSPITSPTKPIDLTESLLQSNISQLISPQKNTFQNISLNQNKAQMFTQFPSSIQPNMSMGNISSNSFNSTFGWNSNQNNSLNNSSVLNFSSATQIKQPLLNQNWSDFDLLSNTKNQEKQSASKQPLISSSNLNNQPNNDIMDLLG